MFLRNVKEINWYKFDGFDKVFEDWNVYYNKVFGVEIKGCVMGD